MTTANPVLALLFFACWFVLFLFQVAHSGVLFSQPGDLYLQPALGYPAACVLKGWLLLFGSLGLLLWMNVSSPGRGVWSRIAGLGIYAGLCGGMGVQPIGLWCTAVAPWVLFAVECGKPGFLLLIPLSVLWARADSGYICLMIPILAMSAGARLDQKQERAGTLLFMAVTVAVCCLFQWRYLELSVDGLRGGSPGLLSVLGWNAPDFQAEPKLVPVILLLFSAVWILRPLSYERIALAASSLLMIVAQSRSQGLLLSVTAVYCALAVDRRTAHPFRLERFEPYMLAFPLLATVLLSFLPGVGTIRPRLSAEFAEQIRTYSGAQINRPLLADLGLAAELRSLGAIPLLEPDFQGRRISNGTDRRASELFADYRSLFLLEEGWQQALSRIGAKSIVVPRAVPVAGVLLEREKWQIRASSSPYSYVERGREQSTEAILLVAPDQERLVASLR